MSIKKLSDGRYEVDIRPDGRNGTRIRRKFNKRHEAVAFERHAISNHTDKPWLDKPTDARPLSELIELWWKLFGKSGDYGLTQKRTLLRICNVLGNPAACQIDTVRITEYKALRLASGSKASTINREVSALGGLFTALISSGLFKDPHPIRGNIKLKEQNPQMSYLSPGEIAVLLDALEGDNRRAALLCLSTGARWSEAARVKREQVTLNRVTYLRTKNNRPRTVPISEAVFSEIVQVESGLLFPKLDYVLFRKTLREVKPDLPAGQSTHSMRHTFATYFMINGGNILTLQRILGHSTLMQTLRYAHFAPDYLMDAVHFNPLKGGISVPVSTSTLRPQTDNLPVLPSTDCPHSDSLQLL